VYVAVWTSHVVCVAMLFIYVALFCVASGCEAFRKSCLLAQEPEDVTVGLVVGKGYDEQLRHL